MSIYNSSESNTFKESPQTAFARFKLIKMCKWGFTERGFKVMRIEEEIPATFDKKYHADLGILLTTKDYDTQYFFIIEIDGNIGHGTSITKLKEDNRDELFESNLGVVTVRLPLSELIEIKTIKEGMEYFSNKIWNPFFFNYIQPSRSPKMEITQMTNQTFALFIANNTFPRCSFCPHPNHNHDLTGCDYRFTDNDKLKCNCDKAFLRSDK